MVGDWSTPQQEVGVQRERKVENAPSHQEPPATNELEHVHEIRDLVEIWQDRPAIEQVDHSRSLRVERSVVVHQRTTQCV